MKNFKVRIEHIKGTEDFLFKIDIPIYNPNKDLFITKEFILSKNQAFILYRELQQELNKFNVEMI